MYPVLVATVAVAVIGFVMGMLLITVGKKFKVEVDEKQLAVREYLPGNNCGGCGYAGCDAMAEAIVKGEAPVNGCPVGGAPVAEKNQPGHGRKRGRPGKNGCVRQMLRHLRTHQTDQQLCRHPRLCRGSSKRPFPMGM